MNILNLERLGAICKAYREKIGKTQQDVSNDTGYGINNISKFETGRNDNARILMWYIQHGLKFDVEELYERG